MGEWMNEGGNALELVHIFVGEALYGTRVRILKTTLRCGQGQWPNDCSGSPGSGFAFRNDFRPDSACNDGGDPYHGLPNKAQ